MSTFLQSVMCYLQLATLLVLCIGGGADGSSILFLTPITSPSHSNFIKPVVKELAERGHFVTYWSGLETKLVTSKNTTNLRILNSPKLNRLNSDHHIGFDDRDSPFRLFFDIPNRMATYCAAIFQDPIFQQLANAKEHYDLIVVEGMFNDCVLPLVRILDTPFIYMHGIAPTPWQLDTLGSPLALEQYPNPASNYGDEMDFWQRTFNSVTGLMGVYFRRWFVAPVVERMASKMLTGDNVTSVEEIEDRYLSLLITNTHFSINYQLPTSSSVIEAGGLHCVPAKALPEDLEKFVQGSGDAGFIIVSFGSILKGADIPEHVGRMFLSAFARLPQRVIWKWEDSTKLLTIPPNVKLLKWLPQQDLLGHPKIRLFITHGGLFSNQEAVYHGVPFIALPVFADQPLNAQKAQDDGYAIRLHWDTLTEEILYDAIQRILNEPSYAIKMEQVSNLMRDQKDQPLDRAIYWIEYVIRHNGAPHLRMASRKLSLWQRGLFDVALFVLLLCMLMAYMAFRISRSLWRCAIHSVKLQDPSRTLQKSPSSSKNKTD